MIDWHSHILPKMYDGSHDTAESVALLAMLAEQGISTVIATPHFYANDESVASFLDRRQQSFLQLGAALSAASPSVLLGAEVHYYQGISRLSGIRDLRIEGSGLLLMEMPMCRWTEYMIREIIEMSASGIRIVLAHIERYWRLQSRAVWDRLLNSGVLMQVNARFFASIGSRGKAISLLKKGRVHFVGSDCHGIVSRPPRIGEALTVIRKRLGEPYVRQMHEYGCAMLALNEMSS